MPRRMTCMIVFAGLVSVAFAVSGEKQEAKGQLAVTAGGAIVRLADDGTYVLEAPCEMSVNLALNDREHELWSHPEIERRLGTRLPQQLDFAQARNILRTWMFLARDRHADEFRSESFRDMVATLWEEEEETEEIAEAEDGEAEEKETARRREEPPETADRPRRLMTGVRGMDITAEEGGKIQLQTERYYPSFTHWDEAGHWLEWEVRIPADGVYMPVFVYAANDGPVYRSLAIDGSVAVERLVFPYTGGWGQRQGDWRVERFEHRLRLRAGTRRIRMLNLPPGGGLNLAWIVFVTPDVTREAILERISPR